MNDKYESHNQNSPATTKGSWEAPSVEELDFSSTEGGGASTNGDGPYNS